MKDRLEQFVSLFRLYKQHWRRIFFRAHKDWRALQAVLLLLGIVLYVAYYGFLVVRNPLSIVMLVLALVVGAGIRRSHAQQDQARFTLSNYSVPPNSPSRQAVDALRQRTLRLALLVWRAGSEGQLRNTSVPVGKEVVTRRLILDKLAELGLRNDFDTQELDLHLLPDCAWSAEQISSVMVRCAELQALKYCVGIDRHMGPLEDLQALPTIDMVWVDKLQSASTWPVQETYDIRKERDEAAAYFLRCLAEKRRRGLYQADLDEDLLDLLNAVSVHAADESHDLLLGTQTVASASQASLEMATVQSHIRFTTLNHVLSELEAPAKNLDSQLAPL